MSESIDNVFKLLSGLENLGPLALLFVVCLGCGYTIKMAPFIQNKYIPLIVTFLGSFLNIFLYPTALLVDKWEHPTIVKVLYGFVVGIGTVAFHNLAISRIENWLESKNMLPVKLRSAESQTEQYKRKASE